MQAGGAPEARDGAESEAERSRSGPRRGKKSAIWAPAEAEAVVVKANTAVARGRGAELATERGRAAAQSVSRSMPEEFGTSPGANTVLLPADATTRRLWSRRPWPPPARRGRGFGPSGRTRAGDPGTRRGRDGSGNGPRADGRGDAGARGTVAKRPRRTPRRRDSARRGARSPRRRSRRSSAPPTACR